MVITVKHAYNEVLGTGDFARYKRNLFIATGIEDHLAVSVITL